MNHSYRPKRTRVLTFALFLSINAIVEADPIRLAPVDQPHSSFFGRTVAIDGNVIIACGLDSQVFVYRFDGSNWIEEPTSFSAARYVAIDDNVAVAGMPGIVTIHRYDGTNWNLEQTLTSSGGPPLNGKVALDASTLLAGTDGPFAHVYRFSDGTWNLEQSLNVTPTTETTVANEDGYVVIGGTSLVSVFEHESGFWQLQATIEPPGNPITVPGAFSVAINHRHLMIGFRRDDGNEAVQVFIIQGGSWEYLQELPFSGANPGDLGRAIALDGDQAILGSSTAAGNRGEVWLYRYCGEEWVPEAYFPSPASPQSEFFGSSVDLNGGVAVVGSTRERVAPSVVQGAVYVLNSEVNCNNNLEMDGCERALIPARDCDQNLVLDECENFIDCNVNGVRDACEVFAENVFDCNLNLIPDECDVTSGFSNDSNADGIPDECFLLDCEVSSRPVFSLKAVSKNGVRSSPVNMLFATPGDVIEAEIFVMCWRAELESLTVYQASLPVHEGANSGTYGQILPLGWDAPINRDLCPCTDDRFPHCNAQYGCVGPEHHPEQAAFFDTTRSEYLFAGIPNIAAVDVSSLTLRLGATSKILAGVIDDGQAHYGGSLRLVPRPSACGTFEFSLADDINYSFLGEAPTFPQMILPSMENLTINVCANDGLFCNGFESCDAELGCQITPAPSCDDGVACTNDACDELTDGCSHTLNHAACDDGEICTRDECTLTGCVNIDDQCGDIPTTSNWGLVILALSFLIMAKWRSIRSARN